MEGALFYSAQQCYIDVECAPARLKVRKNIDFLTAQELADFRRAIKQMLNDNRGFDYFAGWHGVPLGWCQHCRVGIPAPGPPSARPPGAAGASASSPGAR